MELRFALNKNELVMGGPYQLDYAIVAEHWNLPNRRAGSFVHVSSHDPCLLRCLRSNKDCALGICLELWQKPVLLSRACREYRIETELLPENLTTRRSAHPRKLELWIFHT